MNVSEEPVDNFPRHQLQYLREIGRGWFGRVSYVCMIECHSVLIL